MKRIPLATVLGVLCLTVFSIFSQHRASANRASLQATEQQEIQLEKSISEQDGKISTKQNGAAQEADFVPGEVLVKFKDEKDANETALARKSAKGTLYVSTSPALNGLFARFNVTDAQKLFTRGNSSALPRVFKLKTRAGRDEKEKTKALVAALREQPEIEYAELNFIMHTQTAPSDPYYSTSGAWGQAFRDLWGLQAIGAETAWNTTQGANVVVAVVDSGLDYNHEDIAANVWQNAGETGFDNLGRDKRSNGIDDDGDGLIDDWRGWDFVTLDGTPGDNDPMDDHGHGTHVSGTIAAVSNNDLGIAGVAPAAKIMAVKALDANGSGSTADLSNAIIYAADRGASVINNSWGGYGDTPQTLIDAIAYAHNVRNAVVVAAAGNNNMDVGTQPRGFYPACIRNVISVAAITQANTKASFSNYGAKIDVAAPGGGDTDSTGLIVQPDRSILSLRSSQAGSSMTGNGQLLVGTKYLRQAGTSMASPHVAGVAALIRSLHPEFSAEQVRQALRMSSDDIGAAGIDTQFGYGRINATSAIAVGNPLVAQLTGPTGTLSGLTQVNVTGSVGGSFLGMWRLEYGAGTAPTSWTTITTSSTSVNSGVLANWDLTNVPDGTYTLHLSAQSPVGGPAFEDRMTVVIDSLIITSPSPLSIGIVRGGQTITITGTVAASNFARYGIGILAVNSNTWVNPSAITMPNGGYQPVRNGVLGTWDTTGAAGDQYKIYVTQIFTNNTSIYKSVQLVVDPTLHQGWPQNIGLLGDSTSHLGLTDHLDAYDIDGNGAKDLIVAYNNQVNVFDHTGAQLPGWPRNIDPQNIGAHIQISPAVADLDGDGSPEIVAANDMNQVFIFRANGTPWAGWPKNLGGFGTHVAVDDINNDGLKEIIITTGGRVAVFNTNGAYLPGWPVYINGGTTPPAIGDVDGDGLKEIVVATNTGPTNLYMITANGVIMSGWPRAINPTLPSNYTSSSFPVLGDLDGDGKLECVIGSTDGQVYALRYDGSNLSGWPQATKLAHVNSPSIGDIDGDGLPEVVAGNDKVLENNAYSDYLFAWHGDGSLLANWPVKYDKPISSTYFGYGAPALVDLDQDGRADVVVSSDTNANTPSAVNAYKYDGSKVAGFPKPTLDIAAFSTNTVAVADMDGDGMLEMAWVDTNNNIYLWDLTASNNAVAPWPMFQHDERHTGVSPRTPEVIAPTAAITSPSNSTSVSGNVNVNVQAADNVGISKVELYMEAQLVGTITASPYNFIWDTCAATDGLHSLTAKAYDAAGNVGTSTAVILNVDNTAPAASLTAPTNGVIMRGNGLSLSANASDNSGVQKVDFYRDNNVLLGTDTTAPYGISWDSMTVTNDVHTLYVVATDTLGNSATSAVITITVDNAPPSVSLAAPGNGALVAGQNVALNANASDNVGVLKVDFYRDGNVLIGTATSAPYNINWNSTTVTGSAHTIYAVAADTAGNSSSSAVVSVTIDNTAPTVTLTAPASGSLIVGTAVTVSAIASDNISVSRVDFYRDNNVPLGTAMTAPYNLNWNSTTASNGAHTIFAVATDTAGNSTSSAATSITVDNSAPTVSLTAPANGAVVSGSAVVISANASDNLALSKVEFYGDNNVLLGSDTSAPYSINWDSTTYPSGASTLYAVATDTAGNRTTSAAISIIVDNAAPTVAITSPANNATVTRNTTVSIAANASDNVGVTKVEFYVNSTLKCTDTVAPFNCSWLVPNVKTTYNIQAKGYDARGNVGVHAINVTAK